MSATPGWMSLERWNISVRRSLSNNVPVASDSQRTHPITFSSPISARGLDISPSFAIPDLPVDRGEASYPLNEGFASNSLNGKDPAQRGQTESASRVSAKMERGFYYPLRHGSIPQFYH